MSSEEDAKNLADVQSRFEVNISELPDQIDINTYSKFTKNHKLFGPNDWDFCSEFIIWGIEFWDASRAVEITHATAIYIGACAFPCVHASTEYDNNVGIAI